MFCFVFDHLSEAQCVLIVSLMTSDLWLAKKRNKQTNKLSVSSQTAAQRPEEPTSNPQSKATSLRFDIQMCVFPFPSALRREHFLSSLLYNDSESKGSHLRWRCAPVECLVF